MSGGIFLIQADGELVAMNEQAYDSESLLQELLAKYPDLLAGDQISAREPRRWLFVAREYGVPDAEAGPDRWAADHLFLDQDGVPTLIEVKRSSDTRIRREVVGQMLDYAANAVAYWRAEAIRATFEQMLQTQGIDAESALADSLGPETDPEEFWQKVRMNLQAGKLRLIFAADVIPLELRRVVEFLNSQMDPAEVLALEVRQYVGQGVKGLVPRVLGQTAQAEERKQSGRRPTRQWDEASFFAELRQRDPSGKDESTAKAIYEWTRAKLPRPTWGKGLQQGAFVPVLDHEGVDICLLQLLTNGTVAIPFGHMASRHPFSDRAKREELRDRLNAIAGVMVAPKNIDTDYPSIRYSVLGAPTALAQFLAVMDWAVEQVKAT